MLRNLRHYLEAQSHEHRTTDRLEETGVEWKSARRPSLKGQQKESVNPTAIEAVSMATLWKL